MAIIGAILGDIAGSPYEFVKPKGFDSNSVELFQDCCRFTDDTVCLLATKLALDSGDDFSSTLKRLCRSYPDAGYGTFFGSWIWDDNAGPYGSYGNGAAMRVAYIADYFTDPITIEVHAKELADVSHNHPEGVKGAQVTATCIWMAKNHFDRGDILAYCNHEYPHSKYAFSAEYTLDELRVKYEWNDICQGSVPVAIRCFYESDSYEGFIRNVLSLPCDADTICAIGGGIAEEYYGGTGFDDDVLLRKFLDNRLYSIIRGVQ